MDDPYRRLARREVYRNPWLTVEHHDIVHPTGAHGEHVLISGQAPSGVIALGTDDEMYFTIQPRFAARQRMLEIVKGGADSGESSLAAAQRELQEELGLIASRWDELGSVFELPSLMEHPVMLYLARDLQQAPREPEETEAITIQKLPRSEAVTAAISGAIRDAVTCIAILRANALISL